MTEPTPVFIVVQVGVYNHEIYGPFSTQAIAAHRARQLAATDRDDYHRYEVYALKNAGGDWCDAEVSGTTAQEPLASFAQDAQVAHRTAYLQSRGVTLVQKTAK